ncbi:MAG TPA: phosphatidylglycerol lysyltransferase domain-containing protein [Candidatus Saccharimonadia bacterium]|nr:phosphatidylglycerol lysyltransferase domain-containing protein [Candidatus Saccharimonadia bacterium]
MQQTRSTYILTRLVAYIVLSYGLVLIANALIHQLRAHTGHRINALLIGVPQVIGMGFVYLGTLLLRRKYNAWLATLLLFGVAFGLAVARLLLLPDLDKESQIIGLALPLLIVVLLVLTQDAFQVRSDVRTFRRALRVSLLVLCVALVYGISGFLLLDHKDFRREITLPMAIHQTVDQFSLTTDHPVAHTRRARLFMDSLSVISVTSVVYVVISFFDPIRMRFVNQAAQREKAERLLKEYPSDIDDFFKLWPHDKLYFFDKRSEAGLAYHVTRGVALIIGDPFGNPKRFKTLCASFQELCFVNDWRLAFIHVSDTNRRLYEKLGLHMQKLGEEAVVDLQEFKEHANDKYFRQIRNRFTKQGFTVELLEPPHSDQSLASLKATSDDWLTRPGRAERRLTMGYYTTEYMQQCKVAVARDGEGEIQGFINVVPTFEPGTANYDMLRCKAGAPGNCNDFLLLGLIALLQEHGYTKINLGLAPLSGLDDRNEATNVIDSALRFVYASSGRFFSFEGLRRFKAKYQPNWEDRYVAYAGNPAQFARIMTALTRAMKVK